MEIQLYWVSALTYAFVLGIILFSDIKAEKRPKALEKSYWAMTGWVIFFCIQDALWGLCQARVINNDTVFFISSSIFHLSTVITTFFWLKYVLDYLGNRVRNKKFYLALDGIIIFGEIVLVIVNCFTTTLFKIVDGNYIVGEYRTLTFINQQVVYFVIGLFTLALAIRKEDEDSKNYRTVFIFALAPIVMGVCQLLFPSGPFYSLGYFLGCFVIHIFIVANNREVYLSEEEKLKRILELNDELQNKQTELDDQLDILLSISEVFNYINLVDLEHGTARRFDKDDAYINYFDIENDPHTALNKKIAPSVDEHDYDRFMEYTNLSTLDAKMKGKKLISDEFQYKDGDWIRAMYIRVGKDVNSPIKKVAYGLRDITADRKREELIYSALTHLVYSLHMIDMEADSCERLIESDILRQIIGDEESAQAMLSNIIRATCKDEYLDIMLEFVDLSTVRKRMKGKQLLTCEFVGKYHGWTRMSIIPIGKKKNKLTKIVVTTENIDSEKSEMINLIYKSSTDELTRIYNRRMYEEELDLITESNDKKNLILVALDVNGLKTVNDTLGHKAGDELIIGSSQCIKESFKSVGKVYRTGGDEFMAILRCKKNEADDACARLDKAIEEWSGNLVEKLSISYGYAAFEDYPKLNVRELASEADQSMYKAKAEYYKRMGIDRRRR